MACESNSRFLLMTIRVRTLRSSLPEMSAPRWRGALMYVKTLLKEPTCWRIQLKLAMFPVPTPMLFRSRGLRPTVISQQYAVGRAKEAHITRRISPRRRLLGVLPFHELAKKRGPVLRGDVADMVLREETVEQF